VTHPMRPTERSGRTSTLWIDTVPPRALEPLDADATADLCIVGAGIAGLTTAYLASLDGHRVVVLDDGAIGSGETSRTTAHFTAALDDRYEHLEKLHGARGARLAAQSHAAAIDRVESIVAREGLACDFERVDGYLVATPDHPTSELEAERDAAVRAGLSVRLVDRAPTAFDTGPALRFPRQAQLHPLRYLQGLADAVRARGGRIHTGTHATALERGTPMRVATAAGPVVTAKAVVVATNVPVFERTTIHTKQAPYRTYVVVLPVPRGSVPRLLLWDTGRGSSSPTPYHYVRTAPAEGVDEHDHLIVGGEDHKTGQRAEDGEGSAEARWQRLTEWASERFPVAGPPRWRWSGQVAEPVDGLAYLGLEPGTNHPVYLATGDSGNGMTHGTLAGIVLSDLLAGREDEWASLYDPGRITLRATPSWVRENANVAKQYADWLKTGDVGSPDEVPVGGGGILVHGTKRYALFRDDHGALHACDAVCPHLGCIVRWNSAETSWDCPCHGSRFDAKGAVVEGPANRDLARIDPSELPDERVKDSPPIPIEPETA
jgi:glycine/D-amino acid oxidase-like deaminating enzyme/nitrite reductase/ring-hydroxylating ferredoxin subunit